MSDEQKITVDDLAAKVEKLTEALGVKDKQIADLTAERDAIKETQNSESDEAIAKSISNLTRDQKAKQIVELNAKVDTLIKQLDATTESEKLAAKKLAEKEEQIRKLSEAGRRDRIDKLAEQCSIPAMRPFVRVFSDLATREEEVRVYNEETERQEDALVVVERLISFCNNGSERLFTTYSREGSTQRGEGGYDASDELDRRIRKHQQQHPDVDYVAARDYVLDNDPQLKAEYAAALQ
jgi:outer membrane murein-binding lipoprotein Lpp